MPALLPLLEQIREHYLRAYDQSLSEYLAAHTPASAEVLFELDRDAPYAFRLYRADMASNSESGPEMQEANPATHLSFDPFEVEVEPGLHLEVHPTAWNGVDFHLNASESWAPLESWALRWLDVDDRHEQDDNGLQGVIHSITTPTTQGESAEFSVDFGSAPTLAFQELLYVFKELGATEVKVRSSCIE